jgi:hypothetical protein
VRWRDGSDLFGIVVVRVAPRIRLARNARTLPLHRSLLLSGWKRLLEFTIDEEVAKDPTGAPGNAVSPSLDA